MIGLIDRNWALFGGQGCEVIFHGPETVLWCDPAGGILAIMNDIAVRGTICAWERVGKNVTIKPLVVGDVREGTHRFG